MSTVMNSPSSEEASTVSDLVSPISQARGWIKFLAIVQLVFAGLATIASLGIYIVVTWLPIWLSIVLLQSTSAMERAEMAGDRASMKIAMGKLALYFKIQAIAMIVGFAIAVIAGIIAMVAGISLAGLH